MSVSVGAEPARAKATPVSGPRAHERAKATPVSRERFVMPAGYGGAWPVFNPTRRTTHQRPGTAGMEGAGGHKRAWLRRPWAAAGPGRASSRRAERSSRRGRLAGGQATRRPEICRGNKQRRKTAAHRHTQRPDPSRQATRAAGDQAGHSNAGNQAGPHSTAAISGSQAPSGSPTRWRHPPGRAGARNRRRRARGPRPRR